MTTLLIGQCYGKFRHGITHYESAWLLASTARSAAGHAAPFRHRPRRDESAQEKGKRRTHPATAAQHPARSLPCWLYAWVNGQWWSPVRSVCCKCTTGVYGQG